MCEYCVCVQKLQGKEAQISQVETKVVSSPLATAAAAAKEHEKLFPPPKTPWKAANEE